MRRSRSMIAIEPPQPPQNAMRPSGIQGSVRRSGSAYPMPHLRCSPLTRSTPSDCSSKMRSMVSGLRSGPRAEAPPRAMGPRISATARAVPCPLAAPRSAARQAGVLAAPAAERGTGEGPVRHGAVIERGRIEVRRRRDDVGHPSCVGVRQPDPEVGAERPDDVLVHEVAQRQAGQAVDQLADQMAVAEDVVAGRRAGLPPGPLRGHAGGRRVHVVEVVEERGVLQAGDARGV